MPATVRFPMPKDPSDISDFTYDFSDDLPGDDVIVGVDRVDITPDNLVPREDTGTPHLTCESRLFSGQVVTLWLRGGQDRWSYLVGMLVRMASGRTLYRQALLRVRRI